MFLNKIKFFKVIFLVLIISGIMNCGDPIPVEEMGSAKSDIQRASLVQANIYCTDKSNITFKNKNGDEVSKKMTKYEAAKKYLFLSHDYISKGDMGDAKAMAVEASRLAREAFKEASVKLAEATRVNAKKSIQEADDSYAEHFASEDFKNAKDFYVLGERQYKDKNYYPAYQSFNSADIKAKAARNKSESNVAEMKRDLVEVDDTIQEAERYNASEVASSELNIAKAKSQSAKLNVENKKLKVAFSEIKEAKSNSEIALNKAKRNWANKSLLTASEDVKNAEAKVNSLNEKVEDENNKVIFEDMKNSTEVVEFKESLQSLNDTIVAAKDSKTSSQKSFDNKSYTDSYNNASEASRLAKVVESQTPQTMALYGQVVNKWQKQQEAKINKRDFIDTDSQQKAYEAWKKRHDAWLAKRKSWKKYKVRLIPKKRDCLWRIAHYRFIYRNARLWPKIYKANISQIKNPDLIYPGQIFDVPPKRGSNANVKEPVYVPLKEKASSDITTDKKNENSIKNQKNNSENKSASEDALNAD